MFKTIVAACLILSTCTVPSYAASRALMICDERSKIISKLSEEPYKESQQEIKPIDSKTVLEIWANGQKGNWTLLITRPNGTSCVPVTGNNWVDPRGEAL